MREIGSHVITITSKKGERTTKRVTFKDKIGTDNAETDIEQQATSNGSPEYVTESKASPALMSVFGLALEKYLFTVEQAYLYVLKPIFEAVEARYKADPLSFQ